MRAFGGIDVEPRSCLVSPRTRHSNLELLAKLKSEFDNLKLLPREILGFPGALNARVAAHLLPGWAGSLG